MTDLENEIANIKKMIRTVRARGRGYAYPADLKARIIRLVADHDVTAKWVGETVGIHGTIICKWRREGVAEPRRRPSFKRIEVSAASSREPTVVVEGKGGLKIHGLTLSQAKELLHAD